jgi:hypothetical protein
MRLVVFEKNKAIKEDGGTEFSLSLSNSVTLSDGKVTLLNFDFAIRPISGGNMDLDFKPSKMLAENGVLLLGAYKDANRITASFMALDGDVSIEEGVPLLICLPTERVAFRQVRPLEDAAQSMSQIIETSKNSNVGSRKGRKKKKD